MVRKIKYVKESLKALGLVSGGQFAILLVGLNIEPGGDNRKTDSALFPLAIAALMIAPLMESITLALFSKLLAFLRLSRPACVVVGGVLFAVLHTPQSVTHMLSLTYGGSAYLYLLDRWGRNMKYWSALSAIAALHLLHNSLVIAAMYYLVNRPGLR